MAETKPQPLTSSSRQRLQYAQGYLTLGLLAEASLELDGIPSADHDAPDVMDARMHLRYVGEKWPELFDLSTRCTEIFPARLEGWINLAFAARRLKGVESAKAILLEVDPALGKTCALVPYNLACYHCLLGELADARRRLSRAFQLDASLRRVALADDDLKPLWAEIAAVK